jgi:hypothetical protein
MQGRRNAAYLFSEWEENNLPYYIAEKQNMQAKAAGNLLPLLFDTFFRRKAGEKINYRLAYKAPLPKGGCQRS